MPARAGGLKEMNKIYRKEEGVSPVIATILMVAITVVLAATVYIMVSGYMTGTNTSNIQVSLTKVQNGDYNYTVSINTISGAPSQGISWNDVTIKLVNGSAVLSSKVTLTNHVFKGTTTDGNTAIYIKDDGNGKMGPEDVIFVNAGSGATFDLIYRGSTIGTISFP